MRISENRTVTGLLLAYNPSYAHTALVCFAALLQNMSSHSCMVVIRNRQMELPHISHPNLWLVDGDNEHREFSGWDAGVRFCREQGMLNGDGTLIFANDSFCHHNRFGTLSQFMFLQAFRRLSRCDNEVALVGEVHGDGTRYEAFGYSFSRWVSTYMFGTTNATIVRIQTLVPPVELGKCFGPDTSSSAFFTGPMNESLRAKLDGWLLGRRGARARWYGIEPGAPIERSTIEGKGKSVLSEMLLTARVVETGGRICSVFESPWVRQLRRLEARPPRPVMPLNSS